MGHSEAVHSPYEQKDLEILQLNTTQALELIMDKYGDEIKRLIFTYVKNSADTDDITQEVFVTIYRKLNTFQGKSSLKSWIYSIAINKSKDYLRSWQSRNSRLREKLIIYSRDSNMNGTDEASPEDLALKGSESSELLSQVLTLPVKYREVVILFYFKDLTTKEISVALGKKETTIRTRLNRAREQLKNLLSTERGGYDG